VQIRVYYEDTDLGGVVYHANYLKFCERARSELFFQKGHSPIFEDGHFVARHLDASFIKPAKFADILDIKTELVSLKNASFTMYQEIYVEDVLSFKMSINLAYLQLDNTIGRFSPKQKEFLQKVLTQHE